jgi:hypothetical protein
MMPWRRSTLTTQQVADVLHVDANTARRWFCESYGSPPTRYGGWTSKEVARLRTTLKRNRERMSSNQVARIFHVDRTVIDRNWAADGFQLPPVQNLIGMSRQRTWSKADVNRLLRWLRNRYKVSTINGNLGTPVKPCGRRPSPKFFEVLRRTA